MNGTGDDLMPNGSGNLANALDHIAGEGFDDDFLTGDDVTIAQIHSLASSKPSGPVSTPPPITVPQPVIDHLPTPSPRTFLETDTIEAATAEPGTAVAVATLPSPGRTTSNTSSMVSSETVPIVSPLPKVSPRSNMSSPGRKPKSARTEQQLSSATADTSEATAGTPKPRRPSGTGGLPRVAMLAANKPAPPKREETTQRNTPPPFRSGGSSSARPAGGAAATGRVRAPGTPGGASSTPPGVGMDSRHRLSSASASSSPVPGSAAAASGGVSRSSSRSSIASAGASSSSRLAPSASTNSRPAWGSPASGVAAPSRSIRSSMNSRGAGDAPGASKTPPGTVRSTKSLRSSPPPAAGTTPTRAGTISRSVSTSSAASSGAGRGRVVARSSSPSKIPGGPGRTTSITRTGPGGETAAVTGAVAAGAAAATAAVLGKAATAEQPEEDLDLNTLVGLMGEIKDIRHELDMVTPTAADGEENTKFGSASLKEVEDSLPGPEFIASVDTGAGVETEEGVAIDSLEKEESGDGDAPGDGEGKKSGLAAVGGENAEGEADTAEEKLDELVVAVEEEPAPVVVVESRPAFEQQSPVDGQQEKIQAKPLCSCSIM